MFELLQQRADHRAGHAVAPVRQDAKRADGVGVDDGDHVLVEVGVDVDLLHGAATGWVGQARLDLRTDLLDAGVARQGEGALADQLDAGVLLRVVRGGDHRAAVELP